MTPVLLCQGIENRFTYPQSVTRNDGYRQLYRIYTLELRFSRLTYFKDFNILHRLQARVFCNGLKRDNC